MYVLCTVMYQIQWSKYHLPVYMRFITIIKKDKAIIFWEITLACLLHKLIDESTP